MTPQELIQLKKREHRKIFFIVLAFAIIVSLYAIITPPPGVIDWSVIVMVGAIFLFTIVYIAIDSSLALRFSVDLDDKKVEASIGNKEEHHHD